MSNNKNISRSTKRRRFLEDLEMVDYLYDNDKNVECELQPSTSYEVDYNLANENTNLSVSNANKLFTDIKLPGSPISCDGFSINSLNEADNEFENDLFSSDSDFDEDFDTNDQLKISCSFDMYEDEDCILKSLAKWAVAHNITLNSLSSLLKVLKCHKCFKDIPVDARTVLKTDKPNQCNDIQIVSPGLYYHFGVSNGLNSLGDMLVHFDDVIKIVIGIDGLPLTKSSSSTFWPILGYARYPAINPYSQHNIFIIGLYWGKEKPQSCNDYLKYLVSELKDLYTNGMQTKFGKKIVIVDTFCCDCPAKSFILSVKGHAGYSSCIRCRIEGERINNTTCFLETNFSKRTHSDFLNRVDDDHHITSTVSILTEIPGINIVEDFSLDYMHLVCLGVMKKMLLLWLGVSKNAPVNVRIPSRSVNNISKHLLLLNTLVPSDFSRKCRGLNEICRFKATEFRLFLLYTGPVVLKDILNNECYFHFLCLHISFRVLLCPGSSDKLVNFSEKLIKYFVENFSKIYGPQFISHNVHGLLHIVDDYKKFKSLEECSCFPFENYMKVLKKMVRKHEKPLEQVIKRYHESLFFNQPIVLNSQKKIIYKKPYSYGPSVFEHLTVPHFQIVFKNNIKINIKSSSDSYIGFTDETGLKIFKVFNICRDSMTEKNVFVVKHFETIGIFFDKPISSLKLGIAVVNNLSEFYSTIDIENTEFVKYMILTSNSNVNVAYPILHSFNV
ncbi:uncharacterized protein LOC132938225 isoform X1 [Metopolophium dirhodum]|uniref:uncharacterized protein LOC132938225 isoform X1 n=1 Tax=Metopolophium dirhodum TaxID=44670 RepID=UPI00298FD340|nr:uncharacterized protein LOC132938225 isoform X1 [Metopolophium dirhodum]